MKIKRRKWNYTTKYLLLGLTFLLTVDLLLGFVLNAQSKLAMTVLMRQRMMNAAKTAAASLDGDLLKSITAEDCENKTESFEQVMSVLDLFQQNMDMKYIYAVKHLGNKNFVFIVDPDPVDPGKFGEPVVCTDALFEASQGTAGVDQTPFTDRWGKFYSAYCPVFDSNGGVAGIVAVDYDAAWFDDQIAMSTATILFIGTVSLLMAACLIILITSHFRRKINSLYRELSELSDELDVLNHEMNPGAQFDPEAKKAKQAEGVATASSFEALGQKIQQAHRGVKQYVSNVREQDFTDPLTGVGNKTAYMAATRSLDQEILTKTADFSIMIVDVNDLRTVNDQCGMTIGDQMLEDTATLLLQVFDTEQVFHIGSDEFIVLPRTSSPQTLQASFDLLNEKLDSFNTVERTYKKTLSFSKGVASFVPGQDRNCMDVYRRADADLSKNKALYYKQAGDRRKS
jgi:diguanylate cyclase (GGDEF)-like protein